MPSSPFSASQEHDGVSVVACEAGHELRGWTLCEEHLDMEGMFHVSGNRRIMWNVETPPPRGETAEAGVMGAPSSLIGKRTSVSEDTHHHEEQEDMELSIRVCQREDIERVIALQQRWETEAITYGYVADTAEELAGKLAHYYYVADVASELVGFIAGTRHVSEGLAVIPAGQRYVEIDDLYVLPEYRNARIGTQLLNTVLHEARHQGIERFLLYSATKDIDAVTRFYRKHHFQHWNVNMFI